MKSFSPEIGFDTWSCHLPLSPVFGGDALTRTLQASLSSPGCLRLLQRQGHYGWIAFADPRRGWTWTASFPVTVDLSSPRLSFGTAQRVQYQLAEYEKLVCSPLSGGRQGAPSPAWGCCPFPLLCLQQGRFIEKS